MGLISQQKDRDKNRNAVHFPPCPEFLSILKVIMVGNVERCISYRIHIESFKFPTIKKCDQMISFKSFRQS